MNIDFVQGIISYPVVGNDQSFLKKTGSYISFVADNGSTDIAFAQGDANYLQTESVNVPSAWGPLASNTNYWLYWDINTTTGERTFGVTTLEPLYGAQRPFTAAENQHWFDTVGRRQYVYHTGVWLNVIRVFAARFNTSVFYPLGHNISMRPYAGSQVEVYADNILTGRIIADDVGKPIRRQSGEFFTTEDDFFVTGSPITTMRLESTILTATASANIAKHQVVKFIDFDLVGPAEYNDTETTTIAIALEDVVQNGTVTLSLQGHIQEVQWNWPKVGMPLWIGVGGDLVVTDPHLLDPITYPQAKTPVARVVDQHSIMFDQGLGYRGERGVPGSASPVYATNLVAGISRLSVPAVDEPDPIVVGDNDPRNSDARVPLPHNQDAITIYAPQHGTLLYGTLDTQLAALEDNKLALSGGTMTGMLTLAGNPIDYLDATPKFYVDQLFASIPPSVEELDDLTDVNAPAPSSGDFLQYNGTSWVNAPLNLALNDLTDATVALPVIGQLLTYNGTQWVNENPAPAGAQVLDDLTDVTLSAPVSGQSLVFNGTQWVNSAVLGNVTSVNGKVGNVVLTAQDVGAIEQVTSAGGIPLVTDTGFTTGIAQLRGLTAGSNITITPGTSTMTIGITPGAVIPEAPNDGFLYGRQSLQWVQIDGSGVTSLNGLSGNLNIGSGSGISVAAGGSLVTVTNTGVLQVNGKSGNVTLSAGANLNIDSSGPNITFSVVGVVPEAPLNSNKYMRSNGAWIAVAPITTINAASGSGQTLIDSSSSDTVILKRLLAGTNVTIVPSGGDLIINATGGGGGTGSVTSVNDVEPDVSGNVELVATDIGALSQVVSVGIGGEPLVADTGAITGIAQIKGLSAGTGITLTPTGTNVAVSITPGLSVPEAPDDGFTYGRKSLSWVQITNPEMVNSINELTGDVQVTAGNSGIGVSISAQDIQISNLGVTSLNGKSTAVSVVGSTNINVNSAGSDIVISATGLVPEAPLNTNQYVRSNAAWVAITPITSITTAAGTGLSVVDSTSTNSASFRRIRAGSNVTVTLDGGDLVIASTGGGGGGDTTTVENIGGGTYELVVEGNPPDLAQIKTLNAGANITITETDNVLTIASTGGGGGESGGIQSINGITADPETGDVLLTADDVAALSTGGGTMLGAIEMSNYKITGLADPESDQDAVNVRYLQDVIYDSGIYA